MSEITCIADDTRWETVTRTSNGILEEFTISYQSLLPSTAYSFRVIAYNAYGISAPAYSDKTIVTPSKLYLEYGYLQYRPFYRRTWFMVALAAASVVVIIAVVAALCVKSKSYKYKSESPVTNRIWAKQTSQSISNLFSEVLNFSLSK